MLHEFLTSNRDDLIRSCRAKVAKRLAPAVTPAELEYGIPRFLGQLTETLRLEETGQRAGIQRVSGGARNASADTPEIGQSAALHGSELLHRGFTVEQVVHDYGDLCQAVTQLALDKGTPISNEEFQTLNRCLDNAIAGAVGEFGRQRDLDVVEREAMAASERLGVLAHELRNHLGTAMLASFAIRRGNVGTQGATADALDRSLFAMKEIIDRSLAEVRLEVGIPLRREAIDIAGFIEECRVPAALEATTRGCEFAAPPVDPGLVVTGDRATLLAAVANLLHNAFKFTRPGTQVMLKVEATADRVLIEVHDQCGGIPPDKAKLLFQPFRQVGANRSGVGLGLSIARRSVEASGGELRLRNLPGHGCIFTVDLPRVVQA